jgi:hypothetical protein
VANVTGGRLDQYDSSGVVRSSFGSPGTGTGQFDHPMGVAIAANQDIWVADSGNHRIQVFDRNGVFRFAFGGLGTGPGRFRNPAAIAIGANGAVCVADTGNDRVQCFDGSGTYRAQWGATGSRHGRFQSPAGIAVDSSGNVFVVDSGNDRVEVFDRSGLYLFHFGSTGAGPGQLRQPSAIAFASNGDVLVADSGNGRVERFGPLGDYRGNFGGSDLQTPVGLGVGAGGTIAVFDTGGHRLVQFDSGGAYRSAVNAGLPVFVDLSSVFNLYGIRTDGVLLAEPPDGFYSLPGLDDVFETYSGTLLGSSVAWNGIRIPLAGANTPNVAAAPAATLALPPGRFSQLVVLATAACCDGQLLAALVDPSLSDDASQPSARFTVRYTDGSSTVFTQGVSDWFVPHFYPAEWVAVSMRYFNSVDYNAVSGNTRLYAYSFALDASKTVASVQLPDVADVLENNGNVIPSVPAVKILAMTLVP